MAATDDGELSKSEIEIEFPDEEVATEVIQPEPWALNLTLTPELFLDAPPLEELRDESIATYGLDLFARVQALLDFLEFVHTEHGELHDAKLLQLAIARSLTWFGLLGESPEPEKLVPPVDVALVWHSLMIRREEFGHLFAMTGLPESTREIPWRSSLAGTDEDRQSTKRQWDERASRLPFAVDDGSDAFAMMAKYQAAQAHRFSDALLLDFEWNGPVALEYARRSGDCRMPSLFGLVESARRFRLRDVSGPPGLATLDIFKDGQIESSVQVSLQPSVESNGLLFREYFYPRKQFHLILNEAVSRDLREFLQLHPPACDQNIMRWPAFFAKDILWITQTRFYPMFTMKRQVFLCAVFQQYKQWLRVLSSKQRSGYFHGPPFHIDLFWHTHMLCPREYALYTEKCGATLWHRPASDLKKNRTGCCICS